MWWKTECYYCGRKIKVNIPFRLVIRNRNHLKTNACYHCVSSNSLARNGLDECEWDTKEIKTGF